MRHSRRTPILSWSSLHSSLPSFTSSPPPSFLGCSLREHACHRVNPPTLACQSECRSSSSTCCHWGSIQATPPISIHHMHPHLQPSGYNTLKARLWLDVACKLCWDIQPTFSIHSWSTLCNQELKSVDETLDPFRRLHPHYHLEYLDMPCGCILCLPIWNPDFTRSCMLHARCSASRSGHRKLEFLCQDDPRTIQARIIEDPPLALNYFCCYRRFQKT